MKVYLIPGIACDHRLFDRLDLHGTDVVKLDWPPFPKGCSLASIAKDLAKEVNASEPHILVGVSMGGMVAQELAALTQPKKVILISSWTGPHERPTHMKFFQKLNLQALITPLTMWATWPLKRVLGERDREADRLLYSMAKKETTPKIQNGAKAVLNWKGSPWHGPLERIHGDKDVVTPLRFPVDHVVKNAPHIMVLTKPKEVSDLLRAAINA